MRIWINVIIFERLWVKFQREHGKGRIWSVRGIYRDHETFYFFWKLSFVIIVEVETFHFSYCNRLHTEVLSVLVVGRSARAQLWWFWTLLYFFWEWIEYICRIILNYLWKDSNGYDMSFSLLHCLYFMCSLIPFPFSSV